MSLCYIYSSRNCWDTLVINYARNRISLQVLEPNLHCVVPLYPVGSKSEGTLYPHTPVASPMVWKTFCLGGLFVRGVMTWGLFVRPANRPDYAQLRIKKDRKPSKGTITLREFCYRVSGAKTTDWLGVSDSNIAIYNTNNASCTTQVTSDVERERERCVECRYQKYHCYK